nr:hypothetical protein JUJ52_18620 [Virgibacillus sp. AGTR]
MQCIRTRLSSKHKKKGGIYMLLLIVLGAVLVVIALFFTIKVGKDIEERNSEYDTEFKATRKHPVLLNPAFLAYIIGFGFLIIFIAYLAMS